MSRLDELALRHERDQLREKVDHLHHENLVLKQRVLPKLAEEADRELSEVLDL